LKLDPTKIEPLEAEFKPLDAKAGSGAPDQTGDQLRILVVDDDAMSLRYMESHLSKAGHEIATARNAHDAMRVLLQFNPQVVITDWIMPGMDGLQLCRTIRETEIGRQVYVIMVTSHDDKGRLTEAFAAGCDDYLTKPVHPQELCARTRAASRVVQLQSDLSRENSEVQQYAAELSIGNRQLQREVWTDPLTGLPNRRFARESLAEAWEASVRRGQPFACIMVDVDHFKRVNDTFGHAAGDLVLKGTAASLRKSVRRSDVLCRFGGEEFLVVCPDIDANGAFRTAERLRKAIESNVIDSDLFTGNVTISAGAAMWNEGMADVDVLLKLADDALYDAKRAGRNRVQASWWRAPPDSVSLADPANCPAPSLVND
jgi:diguanylate cyclase (GGDEF)-like protein